MRRPANDWAYAVVGIRPGGGFDKRLLRSAYDSPRDTFVKRMIDGLDSYLYIDPNGLQHSLQYKPWAREIFERFAVRPASFQNLHIDLSDRRPRRVVCDELEAAV